MTVHIPGMRILTRTTGVRVAGTAATAAIAAAGLLPAAPASATSVPTHGLAAHAPASGHVYRTLVTGLAVRMAATDAAMKRAVLGSAGARVIVRCFALGQPVGGDSVWYDIAAPHTGFVVGFYLNTGSDPAIGIPRCITRTRHVYRTLVPRLAVRTAATDTAAKRAALGATGTRVTVRCYALGQSVSGDRVWYDITAPDAGFVAGFYLSTGRDPAAGIRRC